MNFVKRHWKILAILLLAWFAYNYYKNTTVQKVTISP